MDPLITISTLAAGVGANMLRELLEKASQQIFESAVKAKQEYEATPKDLRSPLERRRQELLARLSELQTEVMLYVSNQVLLLKLLPILLDQTGQVYQAQTEQDLKLAELSLGQIKGAIEQYRQIMRNRATARWLAVIVSLLALGGLGALIFWGYLPGGPSADVVLPVIQVPISVLLWSAIGSFVAILYRFNSSGDIELQDPLRWLFTRPLTGIVMGTVAYLAVKIGLLSIVPEDISSLGAVETLWLVAFIGGFSDRFADGLLRSLVGRFGGDPQAELVSLDSTLPPAGISSLIDLVDGLSKPIRQRIKPVSGTVGPRMSDAPQTDQEAAISPRAPEKEKAEQPDRPVEETSTPSTTSEAQELKEEPSSPSPEPGKE